MSWPYLPHQCPRCRYFVELEEGYSDERGYETPGICSHPRIAMELFITREGLSERMGNCNLFFPPTNPRTEHRPGNRSTIVPPGAAKHARR